MNPCNTAISAQLFIFHSTSRNVLIHINQKWIHAYTLPKDSIKAVIRKFPSNYLLYAVEEFILFVFGIVVVFQIKNRNEVTEDRTFEMKMLAEIHAAIRQDEYIYTEHFMNFRNKTIIESVNFFDRTFITNNLNKDSADYHFNRLNFGIQHTNNRGPYNALKASGNDKVSNDAIRNKLMQFYDFILARYQGLINYLLTSSTDKMIPLINSLSIQALVKVMESSVERSGQYLKNIDLQKNEGIDQLLIISSDRVASVKLCPQKLLHHIIELSKLFENKTNK